jgi:glutamyl-tRNA reductase
MLNLRSIGISHLTAPLEIREKLWMSDEEIGHALTRLKERSVRESVLISTCNRTELYVLQNPAGVDDGALKRLLIDLKGATGAVREEHFTVIPNDVAVHHLFGVASGIESMIIGDVQILNQVKQAFALARQAGTLGPILNRLMQASLHVGKRVRSETTICEGAVSVSYAAVELASKIFADLSRKSVLLIGAGETGELTLTHLVSKGIGHVIIANRTRAKAEALAATMGPHSSVVDYEQMVDALTTVDIVITSVTSPSYIVQPEDVQKVMKQRSNNPLFIIDIGVPRNVDPAGNKVENVFVYDIDALTTIVDHNIEKRKGELPKVEAIIGSEIAAFFRWYNSLEVGPTIQEFRESIENIRRAEVAQHINRFSAADRDLLELVTRRIINKILHHPTTVLKSSAESGEEDSEAVARVQALRDLFGISGNGQQDREE